MTGTASGAPAGVSSLSTAAWARHQNEAASADMLTVATGLPRLLAKGFALAWQASRGGAVGVLLGGVFTAASLLATTRVLGHLIVPHLSAAQIRQAVPSLVWVAVAAALAGGFGNLSSWLLSRLGPKVDRADADESSVQVGALIIVLWPYRLRASLSSSGQGAAASSVTLLRLAFARARWLI